MKEKIPRDFNRKKRKISAKCLRQTFIFTAHHYSHHIEIKVPFHIVRKKKSKKHIKPTFTVFLQKKKRKVQPEMLQLNIISHSPTESYFLQSF